MSDKEHPEEKLLRYLVEAYNTDLDRLRQYGKTDEGRMMFTVLLTPEEQLQRWHDPVYRQLMETKLSGEGPEAVEKYRNDMRRLAIKQMLRAAEEATLG